MEGGNQSLPSWWLGASLPCGTVLGANSRRAAFHGKPCVHAAHGFRVPCQKPNGLIPCSSSAEVASCSARQACGSFPECGTHTTPHCQLPGCAPCPTLMQAAEITSVTSDPVHIGFARHCTVQPIARANLTSRTFSSAVHQCRQRSATVALWRVNVRRSLELPAFWHASRLAP